MKAQTVLPLAISTILLVGSLTLQAAGDSPTTTLPDNEAQAAARAALYETEPAPPTAAPQQSPAKSDPSAAQPPAATQPGVISTAGPQPDNEAQAKARAALRQDDGFYSTPVETGSMPAKTSTTSQPRSWTAGMEAPKLPITPAQQEQLDQLLQQYRADQISSSEYHAKRAEIIAKK